MPLKRKLITVGNSRAVVIPADWITYYEEQFGQQITEVSMEVNNVITIAVSPSKQPKKQDNKDKI